MWNAVHYDLERNRDLLLDLFRRNPRPLGNDLDVVIRHVRIGLNRKVVESGDATCKKQHRETEYEQSVVQSKINDSSNHLCSRLFCSREELPKHLALGGYAMCIVKSRFLRDTQMAKTPIFRFAEAMHLVNRPIAPRETPDSRTIPKW